MSVLLRFTSSDYHLGVNNPNISQDIELIICSEIVQNEGVMHAKWYFRRD